MAFSFFHFIYNFGSDLVFLLLRVFFFISLLLVVIFIFIVLYALICVGRSEIVMYII